jgi:ribosome biogenesis GTPase
VIILNKADACERLEEKVDEIEKVRRGVPACTVSAKTGQGFEELLGCLGRGQTLVLLGSSGVGKSTIVNRLLGRDLQEVAEVRASDSRGRHTTTARQLFPLPGGALLMDTPGLRELQLWDANEGIAQTFSEIEAFAARCRFTNCTHGREPGCAVQAAIQTGGLDLGRLENWRKVQRELEFLERKVDPEARQNERQRIKRLMRGVRQMYHDREKR